MKHLLKLLIIAFAFTSCGTMLHNNTYDFSIIKDVKDLEGYYLNRVDRTSILSCFNVREYADFVNITSESPNEIKLIYNNDSTKQEQIFTGQMKENFFEIYFSKQQSFIPLIYSSCDIDRIRIGKTKEGKLLIRKFIDQSGNLLFLAGGYSVEKPYIFSYADEYKSYIPIEEDGLWGYCDTSGHIVIPTKYDFATIFERDIACVKLNNKWGLINMHGEEITPIKYDDIILDTLQSPPIFCVYIGEKTGILDINGNEIIPVIYDYIEHPLSPDKLMPIRLGEKWGCAIRTEVVIPAIYSEAYSYSGGRALVKRDGKSYLVDKDGYEYETKTTLTLRAIPKTKRKIQLDEQVIPDMH